jgi:hypothetical protein
MTLCLRLFPAAARLANAARAVAVGAAYAMALSHAWGQSAWPSYPNNTAISVTSGGNAGIGTTSPSAPMEITKSGDNLRLLKLSIQSSAGIRYSEFQFGASGDTTAWGSGIRGYFSAYGSSYASDLRFFASNGSNIPAEALTIQGSTGNVGIGTTNPQYLLSVNGTMGAKDVIVTNTGWADYVFQPGYRLRPLSEVNAYIQAHHHLPDIPSEAEVKEQGVSLGDMQAKLLAKVEELTLHVIQQEKANEELRKRVAQMETRAATASTAAAAK